MKRLALVPAALALLGAGSFAHAAAPTPDPDYGSATPAMVAAARVFDRLTIQSAVNATFTLNCRIVGRGRYERGTCNARTVTDERVVEFYRVTYRVADKWRTCRVSTKRTKQGGAGRAPSWPGVCIAVTVKRIGGIA